MNRMDSFDVDLRWNDLFTRAELISGRATAVRSLEATNVRGGPRSWLLVRALVDDRPLGRARLENVPLGGEGALSAAFSALPCDLPAGAHLCRLEVRYSGGSAELSHPVEVLPDDHICLRLTQADLLAAHVAVTGGELSDFADSATAGVDSRDRIAALCALYEGLRARKLPYQPVARLTRGDYQRVRSAASTLRYGGSCADLSLLFAGLCYLKGLSPVLVMFRDHMMAGAWLSDPPQTAPIVDNPGLARELTDAGALLILDVARLCWDDSVERAAESAQARLASGEPMAMTDVCAALRAGVRSVSQDSLGGDVPAERARPSAALVCDNCGYDRFLPEQLRGGAVKCPSCERLLTVPEWAQTAPDPSSEPSKNPPKSERPAAPQRLSGETARCQLRGDHAVAVGAPSGAEVVRVPDVCQGRPVTELAAQAFAGCRMTGVALPRSLTAVGDYAFRRCERLTEIDLPEGLTALGAGAFSGCGALKTVRVPGTLKRVPRMAFAHCAALERVEIAEGVEEIDERAFEGCAALTAVALPSTLRRVRADAFAGCSRLTDVRISSNATQLDPRAFAGSGVEAR